MADAKELILINSLRAEGALDDGRPSFLRDWEPVRFLGKGSFGEVYQIRRGGENCALKIVEMDDEFIELYAAEIDALERIKNEKHAVRIYEYAIINIDRGPYVQKYMLIRMNLLRKLPRKMTEDQVIAMGGQLCDILEKCHSGSPKILHCDIKPENILYSDDGVYKLSDFGAAKISDKTHNSSGFRGTPLYMSPEMSEYRGYDHRSDLYSLGVTMYALLNDGLPPFSDGENSAQAIRMRFDGKKLPQIEGVSAGMMKILRKLCAAEPDRRYKSARELSRDLAALAAERRKQREADEAKKRAEKEAEKKRAEQEAAKKRAQEAASRPANDAFAETNIGGHRPAQPAPAKRKPFGIIATAAALVAAIVCGVIWLPGAIGGKNASAAESTAEENIPALCRADLDYVKENCKYGGEYEGFEYYISKDNEVVLTGYIGEETSVTIPSEIEGKPVRYLVNTFHNTKITDIVIPEGVLSLGYNTFSKCIRLKSINIPSSVAYIGQYAFYRCDISDLYISDIASWCNIRFLSNSSNPISYSDNLYVNGNPAKDIIIPEGVAAISEYAFYGYSGLTSITIPKSVAYIGDDAFLNCTNLKEVYTTDIASWCGISFQNKFSNPNCYADDLYINGEPAKDIIIPGGVSDISGYSFYGCSGIKSITIPDSVTRIGYGAFGGCLNLKNVYISDITSWCGIRFNDAHSNPNRYADNLYINGKLATDIVIPDGVTAINAYAFYGCTGLKSITVPESVEKIGVMAFWNCNATVYAPKQPDYYQYNAPSNLTWVITNGEAN